MERVRLVVYMERADYEALKVRCAPCSVSNYVRWLLKQGHPTIPSDHYLEELRKQRAKEGLVYTLEEGLIPIERKPCKHGMLFCKKCK